MRAVDQRRNLKDHPLVDRSQSRAKRGITQRQVPQLHDHDVRRLIGKYLVKDEVDRLLGGAANWQPPELGLSTFQQPVDQRSYHRISVADKVANQWPRLPGLFCNVDESRFGQTFASNAGLECYENLLSPLCADPGPCHP